MQDQSTQNWSHNKWAKYWRKYIGVETLPANSRLKIPFVRGILNSWKKYQSKASTDEEFQHWLDSNAFDNGICILTGKVRHRPNRSNLYFVVIDVDRPDGIKELFTRNGKPPPPLQEIAKKWLVTQHIDSPEKAHFGFYSFIPFPEKTVDAIIGLEVRCEDNDGKTGRVMMVAPSIHQNGHPYEIIGTKDPIVLTELQAIELKQHIDQVCLRNGVEYLTKTGEKGSKGGRLGDNMKRMIKKLIIDDKIEIPKGQRNNMMIAVADSVLFNHSHLIPEEKLREYFKSINEKLCKPSLDDNELDGIWQRACRFVESTKEREKQQQSQSQQYDKKITTKTGEDDDSGIRLPDNPEQYDLHEDIYGVMNFTPAVLAVARSKTRQITKAKIFNHKQTLGNTEYFTRSLAWTTPIIDAIPIEPVIRNENPLEESKISFTLRFTSKGLRKPFTVGPATITEIIDELTKRGRILKRSEATDALTSIIVVYERKNRIQINDQISTPGFYWRDGKIVAYHTSQRLDFDPWNNEEHRKEAVECIKILNEWQDRNRKKTALPTALKWTALAPFAFITKTKSRDSDKWLPQFYPYDETDTGKTTLVEDAIAPWGLYKDSENSHLNFKGPGSLDSPAKFGRAASQTTFPVLGDEVGNVFSGDNYSNMLDIQKYAVQNKYIRTVHGEDILALASFAYTSNAPPPRDGAARRRFVAMQFFKEEKWSDEEKKSYEQWMNEVDLTSGKSRKERLSVYGDFVASYIIKHPELIHYSSFQWHEPAIKILKEFYISACTDVQQLPSWLDLLQEQTVVQEAREERHFELVGFLRHTILEAYRMNNYTSPDPRAITMRDSDDKVIERRLVTFERKVDYCLEQGFVPFLYECKRMNGETEIIITANIFHELKRYDSRNKNNSGNSSGYTLAALAGEIPGFRRDQAKINGENNKVVCGPKKHFYKFLNPTIEE